MSGFVNLTGKKFGKLLVINRAYTNVNRVCWECICDCGNKCNVRADYLISGAISSCKCNVKQKTLYSGTPELNVWNGIKQRCYNKKNKSYPRYGGRGIRVCDRWLNSFENFLEDMGKRPSINHSIDRKDNNGNYDASNCRWATDIEQCRNRISNTTVMHVPTKKVFNTIVEAAEFAGIDYKKLRNSIYRKSTNTDFVLVPQ